MSDRDFSDPPSAALARVHHAELVERDPDGIRFAEAEVTLIRDAYARGADETQFRVLVAISEARGLDPRKGHCHYVPRPEYVHGRATGRTLWTVQPSIDYFRSSADATGLYDGQDAPEYERSSQGELVACTVRVWRRGWSRPMVGYARLAEYAGNSPLWGRMPHVMLAKCAESQALRKAFPRRLGGLYTSDEMAQADATPALAPAPAPVAQVDATPSHDAARAAAEQSAAALARDFEGQIEACTDGMALDVVGRAFARAAKHQSITMDQAADLRALGARKRAALKAAAEQAARDHADQALDAMGPLPAAYDAAPPAPTVETEPADAPPPPEVRLTTFDESDESWLSSLASLLGRRLREAKDPRALGRAVKEIAEKDPALSAQERQWLTNILREQETRIKQ